MPLPKLYSARQLAEVLGKSVAQIRIMLRQGRITQAQLVDGRWIIPSTFRIIPHGISDDIRLLRGMPEILMSFEPEKNSQIKKDKGFVPGNPHPRGKPTVLVKGFNKVRGNLSGREIYHRTGVHPATQKKMREGEEVHPAVVLRLVTGLETTVEELLS